MTRSTRDRREAPHLTPLEGGASATAAAQAPLITVLHVVADRAERQRLNPVIAALHRWALFHQVVVHVALPAGGRAVADPADAIMLVTGPGGQVAESAGQRIARVVTQFERLITVAGPQLVVVASGRAEAFACALAAVKHGIPIATLDAGMRIGSRADQAELDRALTDRLGDLLLTSTAAARRNLLAEGVPDTRVRVVGSTLVDSVRLLERSARARAAWTDHGAEPQGYVLLVLGAWPAGRRVAEPLREALLELAARVAVIAVAENGNRLDRSGPTLRGLMAGSHTRFALAWPYLDRLSLALGAGAIVTNLGDVQEEAAVLGVPCYTLADRTERSITVTHGTNRLVGERGEGLADVHPIRRPPVPHGIPLWDGHAAERAAEALVATMALRGRAPA